MVFSSLLFVFLFFAANIVVQALVPGIRKKNIVMLALLPGVLRLGRAEYISCFCWA